MAALAYSSDKVHRRERLFFRNSILFFSKRDALLFFSTRFDKTMKVGAAVVAARRGGLSSTFDELNKFFTISGMPVGLISIAICPPSCHLPDAGTLCPYL